VYADLISASDQVYLTGRVARSQTLTPSSALSKHEVFIWVDDIAQAVKPELMLDPKPAADGTGLLVEYSLVLDPERG